MIVGVLEVRVQDVVVHVLDRQCRLDGGQAQGLELEHGECARGILEQRVVDPEADLPSRGEFALDKMVAEYFPGKVFFHGSHRNTR